MTKSDQATDVLDPAALNNLRELVGNDDVFLSELIDTFLEDAPRMLKEMQQALESGDKTTLHRAAHSLKSNSAEFGAQTLRSICKQLEEMAKEGILDGASKKIAQAETEYSRVKAALERIAHG